MSSKEPLPQDLVNFFAPSVSDDPQSRRWGFGIIEMQPPSAEANERAIFRCSEVIAYKIAAEGMLSDLPSDFH